MKAYEIRDYESEENVGVLLYYEQEKNFIIELKDALDEWTAPLLFSGFKIRDIYYTERYKSGVGSRESYTKWQAEY